MVNVQCIAEAIVSSVSFQSSTTEPWERSDDVIFMVRTVTKVIELVIAFSVVVYGVYCTLLGRWGTVNSSQQ